MHWLHQVHSSLSGRRDYRRQQTNAHVLSDVCIGCELCVPPCPVDCIDILPRAAGFQKSQFFIQQAHSRSRQRTERLNRQQQLPVDCPSLSERQIAIQAAIQRSREKRMVSGKKTNG